MFSHDACGAQSDSVLFSSRKSLSSIRAELEVDVCLSDQVTDRVEHIEGESDFFQCRHSNPISESDAARHMKHIGKYIAGRRFRLWLNRGTPSGGGFDICCYRMFRILSIRTRLERESGSSTFTATAKQRTES